jgi:phosphate transport system substrate-binding protein
MLRKSFPQVRQSKTIGRVNRTNFKVRLMILVLTGMVVSMLSSPALAEEIKIGGSGSALGLMRMLGTAFEKAHPGMKVEVLPSLGSSGGIKALGKGAIDIGLSGRPLKDEELKLGLKVIKYAKTPFIFVANNDVKVANLTTRDIVKIYNGETKTWADGKRVRLVLRSAYESDTVTVKSISPDMSAAVDDALSRKGMLIAMTDQESADLTEKTEGAFGISTLTLIISEKRKVKILSYNSVIPSVESLLGGAYPLSKSLYMVTKSVQSHSVREFVAFVTSPEGIRILEKGGCLAISE